MCISPSLGEKEKRSVLSNLLDNSPKIAWPESPTARGECMRICRDAFELKDEISDEARAFFISLAGYINREGQR
jgi:hypothetical protein